MQRYNPGSILKRWWIQDYLLLLIAPIVVTGVSMLNALGIFQSLEWSIYDSFVKLRPPEPQDSRIVVVEIDDPDLINVGHWPISDEILTITLTRLVDGGAKVIGLDLYRDLAVEPGHQELAELLQTEANIIGAQKIFGEWSVNAPKILQEKGQVAIVDVIEDADLRVRRGLISAQKGDNVYYSLGTRVALDYLSEEGISPEVIKPPSTLLLGQALFKPFKADDGGYVSADAGGYQIILNYRGTVGQFQTISLSDILANDIPEGLLRDRMVFIGVTARSIYDVVSTPYSERGLSDTTRMPGVFIHANLASQIVSGALDSRPFIQVISAPLEWIWVLIWSLIILLVSRCVLKYGRFWGILASYIVVLGAIGVTIVVVVGCSYFLFLGSLWVPAVPSIAAITLTGLAMVGFYGQSLHQLAYKDGLTKVANRRYFDQLLTRRIQLQGYVSIILCDVDHFKLYNDTYGHLAGDACLQKVAAAIQSAVRRGDSVARYGGEEFVVMLPNTDPEAALGVAKQVVEQVSLLHLRHASSKVSNYVTLSCGVTTAFVDDILLQHAAWNAETIVSNADKALYQAKAMGRDRAIMQTFNIHEAAKP